MRLIDADVYKAEMKKRQDAAAEWRDGAKKVGGDELYARADQALATFIEVKLTLDEIPTVDAVPVVHGEWVDGPHGETMCNACGYECETGLLKEIATAFETFPKCCPNCGAKMDKT